MGYAQNPQTPPKLPLHRGDKKTPDTYIALVPPPWVQVGLFQDYGYDPSGYDSGKTIHAPSGPAHLP
jgi:hypothetical protein